MCGISGLFGSDWTSAQLEAMVATLHHRGPDAEGMFVCPSGLAGLGHNRLSVIDLSDAGRQPMSDATGRYWLIYNGEIYNYLELRAELEHTYVFRTKTDSEVLLAAFIKWGEACLDRLIGMFAFVVWDVHERKAFGARDRFGVKPLFHYESSDGGLWIASEIKALHAAGVPREPDATAWSTYLTSGTYDHSSRSFWSGIRQLAPGSCFTWSSEHGYSERSWYDAADRVLNAGPDARRDEEVADELLMLLEDTVRLRFRSDVPVGICLSGGLDSSLLLGLVHRLQGADSGVTTFTFHCEEAAYDERPWVRTLLAGTRHPAAFCRLAVEYVPALAVQVQAAQDEPYGGLPTLGMAGIHERAESQGVVVLLDGNGLDEAWAGYEYYFDDGPSASQVVAGPVQGSRTSTTCPAALRPDFAALAERVSVAAPFGDRLRNLQYRDLRYAKLPRAMRFADRVSMMRSRELREPFLDHRIVELGLRQPRERKVRDGQGKWLVRQLARRLLPAQIVDAPKRAVQTPQREWLRGPLNGWLRERTESALATHPDWLDPRVVRSTLDAFTAGVGDNSNTAWQWISLGLLADREEVPVIPKRVAVRS
jgi:asparagine synthase (glutamine-hydrolysing)